MITPHLPGGGELMQDVVYLLTRNDTIWLNLPAFTRTYQLQFTSITLINSSKLCGLVLFVTPSIN